VEGALRERLDLVKDIGEEAMEDLLARSVDEELRS
jgi:hypothetical protein